MYDDWNKNIMKICIYDHTYDVIPNLDYVYEIHAHIRS